MDTKLIIKKVNKYCKLKGVSNQLYKDMITITTMFNVAKGDIKDVKDIHALIYMMDVSSFSKLVQDSEYNEAASKNAINQYSMQFSYPKSVSKILLAYLNAYCAHTKVHKFEYFYKLGKVDEKEQHQNVELLSEFLESLSQLNNTITECLKYNYSFIIEYARDSLKRDS